MDNRLTIKFPNTILYLLLKNPLHQKIVVIFQKRLFLERLTAWADFVQFGDVVVATFEVVGVDVTEKFRGHN